VILTPSYNYIHNVRAIGNKDLEFFDVLLPYYDLNQQLTLYEEIVENDKIYLTKQIL